MLHRAVGAWFFVAPPAVLAEFSHGLGQIWTFGARTGEGRYSPEDGID